MTRKKIIKKWNCGDVLIKNGHKIIIHEIEENNIKYLSGWGVHHSKLIFTDDIMLQNKWKKVDTIKDYSINKVKKSIHYNTINGVK